MKRLVSRKGVPIALALAVFWINITSVVQVNAQGAVHNVGPGQPYPTITAALCPSVLRLPMTSAYLCMILGLGGEAMTEPPIRITIFISARTIHSRGLDINKSPFLEMV